MYTTNLTQQGSVIPPGGATQPGIATQPGGATKPGGLTLSTCSDIYSSGHYKVYVPFSFYDRSRIVVRTENLHFVLRNFSVL